MIKTTKTPFNKHQFVKSGEYLHLSQYFQSAFLARFKHRGPVTMNQFKKELMANWTVEDYLHQLNVEKKAPLAILRDKNPTWYQRIKEAWMAKNS